MEVLSAAAAAVWMCPECGHGSSELRDERAHLDAHRQLRAFFQEWDAGTTAEPVEHGRPSRRKRLIVALVLAVVVLLVSVTVFSRINRAPDAFRAAVPAREVPGGDPPRPPPEAVTPAPPVTKADPSPARPAPTARPVAPAPSSTTAPQPISAVPASPTPLPPPAVPVPAPSAGDAAPPAARPPTQPHLLTACILGICLAVL